MKESSRFESVLSLHEIFKEFGFPYALVYRDRNTKNQWIIDGRAKDSDLVFIAATIILEIAEKTKIDIDSLICMIRKLITYNKKCL